MASFNEPKKERSRNWFLLLYPDNPEHVKSLEKIPELDWEYVGVLHDSDKLDDGSPAKPHNHVLLKFKDAVWNTAISQSLGLDLRFIQKSDNWNRSARYLVHKDHPEKFQYEKTVLYGSMVERAISAIQKSDPEEESAKVSQIIKLISDWCGHIPMAAFTAVIVEKKLYAEFRRGGAIFRDMIFEHNRAVANLNAENRRRAFDQAGFARSCADDSKWVERCQIDIVEPRPLNEDNQE